LHAERLVTLDELLKASPFPRGEQKGDGSSPGVKRIYIHAGQIYASAERTEVVTILGSCVAVCLYDAARGVGGLNHYMLPMNSPTVSSRYANHAFDLLLRQLLALGAGRGRMEAKIFGGASMLTTAAPSETDLGTRNILAARVRLEQERIPIVAENVGGHHGRKLLFITSDGAAQVKQV
jgi:chemotaxis protein CheD